MDRWKYFDITHRNHSFMNPMSTEKLDELIGLLDLPQGARVVDYGCGKAEPLIRVAQRYQIDGVGIDRSPFCVADAIREAETRVVAPSKLSIIEADGASYQAEPESFDLAICLGASWIFGGFQGTLATLAKCVKPGGLVWIGEPYWRQEPPAEYLAAAGLKREIFGTHEQNALSGTEHGLVHFYAIVSSQDDWDRYEGLQYRAAERYALEHPEDPDVPALLAAHRPGRDAYLRHGRECFGWASYLFLKTK